MRPFILLAWLSVFSAAFTQPVQAAPPANDNRADAYYLDTASPDTSTTVEATMESGEPFPALYDASSYQGTVWWQWTPNFTGWHEVHTQGSAVNTVVAVWTDNNGFGPLTLVHVNDEASSGSGFSSVQFIADNSITYYISVASRTATRGAVTVEARTYPNPISQVNAATFTPSTMDVGSSAATITADLTLASTSSFTSGVITLYGPTFNVVSTVNIVPQNAPTGNRISGNQSLGVYRMTLTVPQGSTAGTYRWAVRMSGTITNSYGWDGATPLAFGIPTSVTVTNTPPAAPFDTWAAGQSLVGGNATRAADPDGDGLNNLTEYVCGLNPQSGTSPNVVVTGNSITSPGLPLITTTGSGDQQRLRVVFLRRLGDSTVNYTVQFGDDMSTNGWSNATQSATVIASNSTFEALAVEDDVFVPAKTRRFARVKYVYTP